jgi:hypothetical protein
MPVVFMDTCQVTDTCEVTPDRRPRNVEEEKVGVACFRARGPWRRGNRCFQVFFVFVILPLRARGLWRRPLETGQPLLSGFFLFL